MLWKFLFKAVRGAIFGLLVCLGWLLIPPRYHRLCPPALICWAGFHFHAHDETTCGGWYCKRCDAVGYEMGY